MGLVDIYLHLPARNYPNVRVNTPYVSQGLNSWYWGWSPNPWWESGNPYNGYINPYFWVDYHLQWEFLPQHMHGGPATVMVFFSVPPKINSILACFFHPTRKIWVQVQLDHILGQSKKLCSTNNATPILPVIPNVRIRVSFETSHLLSLLRDFPTHTQAWQDGDSGRHGTWAHGVTQTFCLTKWPYNP